MDLPVLPIHAHEDAIVQAVRESPVVIVIAETGSGKTTQISQMLYKAGMAERGMIGITQPRRVAAVSVARRVSQEMDVEVGGLVGYAVRFEERSSSKTRIKYLTDGTLLRELLSDAQLQQYSVVVLDEAHERSLNTDILFGVLKDLVRQRKPPLKLVVTSATLEGEKFSTYFYEAPILQVPGRCFDVHIVHSTEDHDKDYLQAAVDTALEVHCTQPTGDILIFLTGQAEIDKAVHMLNDSIGNMAEGEAGPLAVLPLYAALPPELQVRIFQSCPPDTRRCIVATNIAETSVTVPGVVYVIDSGVVKQKEYNPITGMDTLDVVPISKVQATQRAGRAGRTQPGKCFRLYTRRYFEQKMNDVTIPEIQRMSLVGAVLHLKSLKLDIDVLKFDYLDPPAREQIEDALRQLYILDAIDVDGRITDMGIRMTSLPLDPALCRALLAAKGLHCLQDCMTVIAMLSVETLFTGHRGPMQLVNGGPKGEEQWGEGARRGRRDAYPPLTDRGKGILEQLMREGLGDHVFYLRLYQAWEMSNQSFDFCRTVGIEQRGMRFARDVRRQIARIMEEDDRRADGRTAGAHGERDRTGLKRELDKGHERQEGVEGKEGDRSKEGHEKQHSRGDRGGHNGTLQDDKSGQRTDEGVCNARYGGRTDGPHGGRKDVRSRDRQRHNSRGEDGRTDGRDEVQRMDVQSYGYSEREHGRMDSPRKRLRMDVEAPAQQDQPCSTSDSGALRQALLIGMATRLAFRLPRANGYKTMGRTAALAQLHPTTAAVEADEEGLLPKWLVYNELISTSSVFLSKVCVVEDRWVDMLLPKLQDIDVARLGAGKPPEQPATEETDTADGGNGHDTLHKRPQGAERRNDAATLAAARARYLARKQAEAASKKKLPKR